MPGDDLEKLPTIEVLEWRSRPRGKRGRRTLVLRILAVALGLWCWYTFYLGRGQFPLPDSLVDNKTKVALSPPVPLEPPSSTVVDETDVEETRPSENEEPEEEEEEDITELDTPSKTILKQTVPVRDDPQWPRSDLSQSLRQLLALLPDESQVQGLLRPIESTGEARLRDLGLRTRQFHKLFDAWEAVHLVPASDGKALYIRDDIIQHIQQHPQLPAILKTTTTELIHSYESYRSIITQLASLLFPWTAPYYPDHMHLHTQLYRGGRGLVFSAGDNQAPFLLTSIPTIRSLGCDLPIEIMYLGDRDLSEDIRAQLEALPGVTTRDLSQMVNDKGWQLAGWAGKPFAILFSSFREAIFIDADSLFFQNPEILFEDEAYVETGALFFKDRLMFPESKKRWLQEVLPKPISPGVMKTRFWKGQSGHMQESGVVVVDKWRHFVALLLVTRMNGPDRDGNVAKKIVGVYDMVYGDKETFWIGWELVRDLDYAFHDGEAGIMGVLEPKPTGLAHPAPPLGVSNPVQTDLAVAIPKLADRYTICAPQLLHLDREGRPLWFNGWLLPNKFVDKKVKDRQLPRFEAFIKEPREVQDPEAWQLRENNVCCLSSEEKFEFSEREIEVLQIMVENGQRVGAIGKGTSK